MKGRYLYQVGDRVRYHENMDRVGTISQRMSFDEETGDPSPVENPDRPWYHIDWDENNFTGFECEEMLVPEYVSPIPNRFIRKMYEHDRGMWLRVLNMIR